MKDMNRVVQVPCTRAKMAARTRMMTPMAIASWLASVLRIFPPYHPAQTRLNRLDVSWSGGIPKRSRASSMACIINSGPQMK